MNYTNPANGATGVAVITATFSEAMNASTISVSTITLAPAGGGAAIPGTVAYDPSTNKATFTPSAPLS